VRVMRCFFWLDWGFGGFFLLRFLFGRESADGVRVRVFYRQLHLLWRSPLAR
jgi:hypothetical protein